MWFKKKLTLEEELILFPELFEPTMSDPVPEPQSYPYQSSEESAMYVSGAYEEDDDDDSYSDSNYYEECEDDDDEDIAMTEFLLFNDDDDYDF